MPRYTSKHTGKKIDDTIDSVVNPNLLDNWYFGNPVDQRQGRVVKPNTTYYSNNTLTTSAGTTSAYVTAYRYATGTASGVNYASFKLEDKDTAPTYYAAPENIVRGYTGRGYGIDMWKSLYTAPVVLIHDDGIVLQGVNGTNGWGHVIDKNISGMTCTLSVLTETTLYSNTVTIPTSGNYELINKNTGSGWFYGIYRNTNDTGDAVLVRFFAVDSSNASPKIKAVKLELGSQQTLAHQENGVWVLNEIPNYGEQLERCQRYQRMYAGVFSSGGVDGNNILWLPLEGLDNMRTTPSITDMDFTWLVCDGVELPRPSNFTVHGNAIGISNGANYPIHKVIAAYFTCFADANL